MLKNLILIRLQSVLSGMFSQENSRSKNRGSGTKILLGILFLYVFAMFLLLFGQIFLTIRDVFVQLEMTWLYFGFMGLMVFLLGFIGSVFLTQTQLFEARDNEMLLSMPITPRCILASRMISLTEGWGKTISRIASTVISFSIMMPQARMNSEE